MIILTVEIMRKLINIDRVKMKALGYSKAPIRQICMLNLSSEEMIVLLNFFSHKHNWDIGNIGISERNFYKEKNKKRVRQITNKLKTMGYLSETDTHYIVELENIQKDYEHNLKEVETRIAIKQRERAKTRKQKVNVSGVTQNNPSNEVEQMLNIMLTGVTQSNYKGVTQSNYKGVTQNNPNNNNNNAGGAHEVSAPTTSNKPTNDVNLDVGDCVSSAASSASQTSQTTHTPTVVNNKIMSKENIGLDYSKLTLPKEFEDEIEKYKTSKFFKNTFKIRFAYERYGKLNPSKFITISKFEKLIFLGMFKYYECKTNDDVNTQCLYDERIYYPVDKIEDIVTYSKENKDEVTDILNKHQIRVDDYTPKVKIEDGVYKYTPKKGMTIIEPNPDDYDLPF